MTIADRPHNRGFSLVEVTLAIGIVGFGVIAILGLIPVGTKSGGDAIDATRTALIGKDAQARARATVTYATFASAMDVTLPTGFYDREGNYLGTSVTAAATYRVDGTVHGSWGTAAPVNVDATVMRAVTVQLRWPVNTATGAALGSNARSFSFYVRRP
jgi:uncharacterized protein (TIGR02598 family)